MKKYMVIAVTALTLAFPAFSHAADEMKEDEMMMKEQQMMEQMNEKMDKMEKMEMEKGEMMEKK